MTYPIPADALDDRLAVMGTAGSGKTYSVLGALARLLKRGSRAIAFDALGVMYGIRLAPDGESPSPFKPVIFGGPHGDLPLTPGSAALIGETIATMAESVILDLSQIGTKAAERRFMLGVLQTLYRHANKEPVHLLFDEADLWAPQKLLDKEGEAAKLLGMMEQIVRRGRIKGFIPWLITQRPAVLSKDVLSQADGIVAMKLTASQDRDAIGAWIEGQADRAKGKEILALLPTMAQGEGVIWIPGRQVLKTARFPANSTYDSSRTPKRGESVRKIDLKPLDLGKLKTRLAAVEQEAKANDPAALRAQVAALSADLAKARKQAPVAAGDSQDAKREALRSARLAGALEGAKSAYPRGYQAGFEAAKEMIWGRVCELSNRISDEYRKQTFKMPKPVLPGDIVEAAALPSVVTLTPAAHRALTEVPARMPVLFPGDPATDLEAPLQKIVDAIRWWNILVSFRPNQVMVGAIAGYSPKSGTWSTYLARLRGRGLVEGKGELALTAEGVAASRPPSEQPTGAAVRAAVLSSLKPPLKKILEPLLDVYPHVMTQAEVAEKANYSPQSGTWSTYLARLRGADLVEGKGELKAKDWLFPGGL